MKEFKPFSEYSRRKVTSKINSRIQSALDRYELTKNVADLSKVMEEPVAHTIDVIYKESVRTLNEDCTEYKETGNLMCATFETPYELFDKDKVFFGKDVRWRYPISIDSQGRMKSNFENHNHIYLDGREMFDEEGRIYNFYQDIDIFGTPESWTKDLLKALYGVVDGIYKYWKFYYALTHNDAKEKKPNWNAFEFEA